MSCMRKLDKQGLSWLFPVEAKIYNTSRDPVIARNIEIEYSMAAGIICKISRELLTQIEQCFAKI